MKGLVTKDYSIEIDLYKGSEHKTAVSEILASPDFLTLKNDIFFYMKRRDLVTKGSNLFWSL